MAVEFRTTTIDVPKGRRRRELIGKVSFQRKVRVANIALRGVLLDFVTSDHHINVVEVTTDFAGTEGEIVRVRVNCQYADKNFDDEYFGHVDVAGPTKHIPLPSGSRTTKSRPPHACFLSFWSNIAPAVTYSA